MASIGVVVNAACDPDPGQVIVGLVLLLIAFPIAVWMLVSALRDLWSLRG